MKFNGLRFTNIAILVVVLLLTLTGLYGLFWTENGWVFTVHRAAGWGLIALLPWKTLIVINSLRQRIKRGAGRTWMVLVSLFLAVVSLIVLVLGIVWHWRFGPEEYWLRQTAVSWHWMLALGLLAPFLIHTWQRWPFPKKVDFASRRAILRMTAAGALTLAGYAAAQAVARLRELPAAPRRFTGSRLAGYHSGNDYPVTHNLAARPEQVDPSHWKLQVGEQGGMPVALLYDDLLAMPSEEIEATIDCTLGWFAVQRWRGITLSALLARAGVTGKPVGVRLESVTGYAHILPYWEAEKVLLATHVGDETLNHSHGFPIRAVVPTRRGWFWVKWLAKVEAVDYLG